MRGSTHACPALPLTTDDGYALATCTMDAQACLRRHKDKVAEVRRKAHTTRSAFTDKGWACGSERAGSLD